MSGTADGRRRKLGLFGRVYLGLCLTGFMLIVLVAGTVWVTANSHGQTWVDESSAVVESHRQAFLDNPGPKPGRRAVEEALAKELDAEVRVLGRPFRRHGPPHLNRPEMKRLHRGLPVVHKRGMFAPPNMLVGVTGEDQRLLAIVEIHPRANRERMLLVVLAASLGLFGAAAWFLTRNPTRRLEALRDATGRLADGALDHRLPATAGAGDEIDELAGAFNNMAERIEGLVDGQKTLLANVSHELRTPIARMKVLNEILADRTKMAAALKASPELAPHMARLAKGFGEMDEDLAEMELLVADLLASGRLELGDDAVVERTPTTLAPLCERVAGRFGAIVVCPPLSVLADEVLLERMLRNLLTNARRACPDGAVRLIAHERGDRIEIAVEDEGRGIPAAARERIFEPFARLDQARDRDRGGVGLGLFLCRQIARAHGGEIWAEDRSDGKRGARLVISLPSEASQAG